MKLNIKMCGKLIYLSNMINVWAAIIIVIISEEYYCSPFIVQSLSSNYGLVLGGYGPGYEELRKVEVVKHNKVCPDAIRQVWSDEMHNWRSGIIFEFVQLLASFLIKACPYKFIFSSDVPMENRRFLGDISGMAEFVGNDSVIFCRHRYAQVIKDFLRAHIKPYYCHS